MIINYLLLLFIFTIKVKKRFTAIKIKLANYQLNKIPAKNLALARLESNNIYLASDN